MAIDTAPKATPTRIAGSLAPTSYREDDSVLVKMTFPFNRNAAWDGNAMNANASQIYRVITFDLNSKIGDTAFSYTANINQIDNGNLIEEQKADEVYARRVGLVFKRDYDVEIEVGGKIKKGHEYTWTYVEHGTE